MDGWMGETVTIYPLGRKRGSKNDNRLNHSDACKVPERAGMDNVVNRQYQRIRKLSEEVETLVVGRIPIRDELWVLGNPFLQSFSRDNGQP